MFLFIVCFFQFDLIFWQDRVIPFYCFIYGTIDNWNTKANYTHQINSKKGGNIWIFNKISKNKTNKANLTALQTESNAYQALTQSLNTPLTLWQRKPHPISMGSFVLHVGNWKRLIKRKEFEKYLSQSIEIWFRRLEDMKLYQNCCKKSLIIVYLMSR